MSGRTTSASVTDAVCECKYLQRAADDPDLPIVFDERLNEYHFVYSVPGEDGSAVLNIYHCPFCGGAAPASKRRLLFQVVSSEEKSRLADLLVPMGSLAAIIEAFGPPDRDDPTGSCERHDETSVAPSRVIPCRMLTYTSLSIVADVQIFERQDGTIGWGLTGKYIAESTAFYDPNSVKGE